MLRTKHVAKVVSVKASIQGRQLQRQCAIFHYIPDRIWSCSSIDVLGAIHHNQSHYHEYPIPNAYQNDLKCLNSASLHQTIMNEHTCTTLLQKAASSVRTTHLTQSRGIQRRTVLSKLFSQKKPGHSSPVPCSSKVVRDAANGTRIEFNGVSWNAGEYKSTTIFYNTYIYIYMSIPLLHSIVFIS